MVIDGAVRDNAPTTPAVWSLLFMMPFVHFVSPLRHTAVVPFVYSKERERERVADTSARFKTNTRRLQQTRF